MSNTSNQETSFADLNLSVESVKMNLARNIIAARTALKMSQDSLSIRSSISRATIIQIEGGDGDPRLSTLISLAAALKISPIFLFMSRHDLEDIAGLCASDNLLDVQKELSDDDLATMKRLIQSGISRNRGKAIKMGTSAAASAGVVAASAVAGAAIGSILLPGIGTAVGAVLGGLFNSKGRDTGKPRSKSRAKTVQPNSSDDNHGEG